MQDTDAQVDAVILAGGRGTRLRSVVSDVPKPLAPVNGRPFLDYQLDLLAACGRVRSVVLAIGHLAERVQAHYEAHPPSLPLRLAIERELLGTGGALANAAPLTTSARVLVLNGDSLFAWSLPPLLDALDRLRVAGAALGLVQVPDAVRYGSVDVDDGLVVAFREKDETTGPGLINGGVYCFDREVVDELPKGTVFSLEREVFPRLSSEGRLAAVEFDSEFIDIGLPETYAAAAAAAPRLARQVGAAP